MKKLRHCHPMYSTIYEKLGFKNATNVLGSLTVPGPTGGAETLQHGQNLQSGTRTHQEMR